MTTTSSRRGGLGGQPKQHANHQTGAGQQPEDRSGRHGRSSCSVREAFNYPARAAAAFEFAYAHPHILRTTTLSSVDCSGEDMTPKVVG
jgi:hypothetical protein